ncbi:hypothetical protein CGJ15_27795, partial [Vibrio parahaemolyticus]
VRQVEVGGRREDAHVEPPDVGGVMDVGCETYTAPGEPFTLVEGPVARASDDDRRHFTREAAEGGGIGVPKE